LLIPLGILIELVEVDEELLDAFLSHAYSCVDHTYLDVDIALLPFILNDFCLTNLIINPVLLDNFHHVFRVLLLVGLVQHFFKKLFLPQINLLNI
jgi:hypothetical protein